MQPEKLERLLEILSTIRINQFVHPGMLIRNLNLSMKDVYAILEHIKKIGAISVYYEVYCNSCQEFTGIGYETINQIPEYVECERCGKELNPIEDVVVIYRVTQYE